MFDNPFGKKIEFSGPDDFKVASSKITLEEKVVELFVAPITKVILPEAKKPPQRRNRKAEILAKYGGLQSNVPVGHEYWKLKR